MAVTSIHSGMMGTDCGEKGQADITVRAATYGPEGLRRKNFGMNGLIAGERAETQVNQTWTTKSDNVVVAKEAAGIDLFII